MQCNSVMANARAPLAMTILLCACSSPDGRTPHDTVFPTLARDKVDLLFVVDNSSSMAPKQKLLAQEFTRIGESIRTAATAGKKASYHIGVITTDIGALDEYDSSCKPGGLKGSLQAKGASAPADCVAPQGAPYIDLDTSQNTNNINGLAQLPKALSCMAAVGDQGCAFEQPLESLRVALSAPENAGFFRDDALLVIAILTDEDDCSSDDPDLYLPYSRVSSDLGFQNSFRCSRFGLTRENAGGRALLPYESTSGPVANVRPATKAEGGRLIDLSRYVDLLAKPRVAGGAKDNPNDVIIGLIAAPASPVEVILASTENPTGSPLYTECDALTLTCVPTLQHSCSIPVGKTMIAGDPAVRLHTLVSTFPDERRVVGELCALSYQTFFDDLLAKVSARLRTP